MAITRASLLAILGCLCFCSSALGARELNDDLSMVARHEGWMAEYGRVYKDAAEKAERFEIFKANAKFIESFNAGNHKFWLSINQFADLSNDEFRATKRNKGFIPNKVKVPTEFRYENMSFDALPATMDWRTKGAVVVGHFPLLLQQRAARVGSWTTHSSSLSRMEASPKSPVIHMLVQMANARVDPTVLQRLRAMRMCLPMMRVLS
uniref:Cathepsin propeptide inhibitor domain-containing protein n=1 Tax=Aegilops tauschii subsp. strangulata TaxID=200361 RepID=A0A452YWS0_AEGTS